MHEKGIKLINKALKEKKLEGINIDCNYLPCHDFLEDCTFCYCPFYPCQDDITGGFEKISSRTGKPVWSCSDCIFPHVTKNAQAILEGLLEIDSEFSLISKEELKKLRNKILNETGD